MDKKFQFFCEIGQLYTLKGVVDKDGRGLGAEDLGVISDAAMLVENGKIIWVGRQEDFDSGLFFSGASDLVKIPLHGASIVPGFIECHTHLVFSGDRENELDLKAEGLSYTEIANRGGGIHSTVKATRESSHEELVELAQKRVDDFVRQGVTTLEVKSGYGLDLETEVKMLEVSRQLKGPDIQSTFLGPHAVPKEFSNSREYITEICENWLPGIYSTELAKRADIFVEEGFFSVEDARAYYSACQKLGYSLTGHMDQITRSGGVALGVELKLDSVDHCIEVNDSDIQALAESSTTAVLLPSADLYLGLPFPPAREMESSGVRVALATDFNPGSAPTQDMSLTGVLSRVQMHLSLTEVLAGYTYNAGRALGLSDRGALLPGFRADFVTLRDEVNKLFYQVGHHPVHEVYQLGKMISKI